MKLSKKLAKAITSAAESNNKGTTFYRVTLDQLKEVFSEGNDSNLWMIYAISEYGFNAIRIEDIWGSAVIEDELYLCKTDGNYISVKGQDDVEPETALETYDIVDLFKYIVDDTPAEVIKKMITDDEFNFHDLDELAFKMMEDGHSFLSIAKDAKEIYLLDEE